jgi:Na+-driven multidrug efflux pump
MFMIPLGISVSASTMIGNLLGASDPHSAHKVSVCARIAIVTLASMYGVGFLLARNYVPHVSTGCVLRSSGCRCIVMATHSLHAVFRCSQTMFLC